MRRKGPRVGLKTLIRKGVPLTIDKEVREEVVVLAGQFKKHAEISGIIKEKYPEFYNKVKSNMFVLINNIMIGNKNTINAFRERYIKEVMEVPGAHKRVRLERLEALYDKDKIISGQRETVKAMREEMEGARVNLNLYQLNMFGGLSDEELARREAEIIARIRADSAGEAEAGQGEGISLLPSPQQAETVSPV